jgi:predicted ATPase/DNA-binding XRE family transcriptional regulator
MDSPETTASDPNALFGRRLRHAREVARLTQEELAALAGLSTKAIGALERGERRHPYPSTVRALAAALKLTEAEYSLLADAVPPRHGAGAVPGSPHQTLPTPRTSFVGRTADVATARALLLDEVVPLLTLTGTGGVGKTRLALAIAHGVAAAFPDGVVFVDLAPLRDPDLILTTIAQALSVRQVADRSLLEGLSAFLRSRRLLLILDNVEHLLPGAVQVIPLLESCPSLQILATSRAPLRIRGEQLQPVAPLALPAIDGASDPTALGDVEAVALFVARARAAAPEFALTEQNAANATALCRRLDGLPLALELAAARMRFLSVDELLKLLSVRLRVLTGGERDRPQRQQTLRDAIAWSYDLLPPDEQVLFRRLAVFAGGCTLQAAEAVACITDGPAVDVLTVLLSLVDHSLVQRQDSDDGGPDAGTPRFRMLETIREFALERLVEGGEWELAQDAHAAYFIAFAERNYPYRIGPGESIDDRLWRSEVEHPNFRAALTRMANVGDAEGVLQLAGALVVFWNLRGHLREGQHWLELALHQTTETPTGFRSRALSGLGYMVWPLGHPDQAAALSHAGLAIAEQIGDNDLAARSHHMLGLVAEGLCRWDAAQLRMERALGLWRELDMLPEVAMVLNGLSVVAYGRGDAALATRYAEESLAMTRAMGHAFGSAIALPGLARLARDRGDDLYAAAAFHESLHLWASIGDREIITQPLAGLGELASVYGQAETAATLVGAVDTLADEAGDFVLQRCSRFAGDNRDRAAERASAALGEERFAQLRTAGRALPLEEAVALAATVIVSAAQAATHRSSPAAGPLTPRSPAPHRQR